LSSSPSRVNTAGFEETPAYPATAKLSIVGDVRAPLASGNEALKVGDWAGARASFEDALDVEAVAEALLASATRCAGWVTSNWRSATESRFTQRFVAARILREERSLR
jgi:hypothetical protein